MKAFDALILDVSCVVNSYQNHNHKFKAKTGCQSLQSGTSALFMHLRSTITYMHPISVVLFCIEKRGVAPLNDILLPMAV